MRAPRTRFGPYLETMESRMVLSGLTLAPAPHAPGASAAEVEKSVATPLVVSRDTVTIQNNTGFHIDVTARLLVPGSIKPTISRRIGPKGATETFSFGRHTNDFIEIDVRRTEAEKPPPPFTTTLHKPPDGYHGKLFTVSEIDGRFHVSI